jgi:hypothetical protein
MKRRALGLAVLVLLIGVPVWVFTHRSSPRRVSEAEARDYLGRIVAAAQARDFEAMCAFNHAVSNCQHLLDYVGRDTAPSEPPTVVSARYDPKRGDEGDGMVLTVEGVDARGKAYRTEVFVFQDDETGGLSAVNAVYWSGAKFTSNGDPSSPDPPSAASSGP